MMKKRAELRVLVRAGLWCGVGALVLWLPGCELPSLNAPLGLTAVALSSTQILLEWEDVSTGEDGHKIERKANGEPSFAVVGKVGSNTQSYVDSGLTPNTTYTYRAFAYADGSTSSRSNEAQATTPP
jgi:hypothetical protein